MIDSMSPGTTLVTSLESYPGVQLSVTLSGTTVAASFGRCDGDGPGEMGAPATRRSPPGETYSFTLNGVEVVVAQARNG